MIKTLILAVCLVESGLDTDAYNDREKAIGCMQIRPCVIEDMNRIGMDVEHRDCYDADVSAVIFKKYGKMYGAETAEEYARIWNGGPDGAEQECTEGYWKKVKTRIREIENGRR